MSAAATPVRQTDTALTSLDTAAASPNAAPASHERIAEFAYSLWLLQGCPAGCAEANWLEAEKQLANAGAAETVTSTP